MEPAMRRGTGPNTTHRYPSDYQSVAPSVEIMIPDTSSYDELTTPAEMHADCEAVEHRLVRAASQATRPAPSLHFDEQPRERAKRDIEISDAAARLASAIYG